MRSTAPRLRRQEGKMREEIEEKSCTQCGQRLPLNDFYNNRSRADGKADACKQCHRAGIERYRAANKEKCRKQAYRWLQRNLAARRAKQAIWRRNNPEKCNAILRRWRERHPEACKAHNIVGRAKRNGTLVPPSTCEHCGKQVRLEAHHPDYSKPLEVIWLCIRCHDRLEGVIHDGLS